MTDTEIIKALECCTTKGAKCSDCPAFKKVDRSDCKKYFRGAIDLINRQQKEVERLKAEEEKYPFKCVMPFNSMVCSKSIEDYDHLDGNIWAEAVKEFAEHLKEEWFNNYYDSPDVDFDEFVDNLVKEYDKGR